MSTATDMRDAYIEAETALLKGQTFRFGDRQLTRADLAEVRKGRAEWERRASAEASGNAGVMLADFTGCRG